MTKISPPSGQKCPYPRDKNVPENNTDINTTFNNTKEYICKSDKPKRSRFTPPSREEVQAYCLERKNNVNAERFIDYYTSNGWHVGKHKMQDWKAAVRTWEKNGYSKPQDNKNEGWCMPDPNDIDNLDDLF